MDNTKILFLKGCAGIGNRFITLQKAINYAQFSQRKIYVDWADGMFGSLNENIFYEYFDLINISHTCDLNEILHAFENGASTYPKGIIKSDFLNPLLRTFYALTPKIAYNVFYKVGLSIIPLHKIVYILGLQSFHRISDRKNYFGAVKDILRCDNFPLGSNMSPFLNQDIVFFADFRPFVSLKNLFHYVHLKEQFINRFLIQANEYKLAEAVGVHIRYTDKQPKRSLNKLIKRLQLDLELGLYQKVFICSDNNDIIEKFNTLFPNKIITTEKYLPIVKSGGIHIWAAKNGTPEINRQMFENSLADMWLLSMCKYLYWQGNSSFSLMSKLLKNDKKTTFDWMKF